MSQLKVNTIRHTGASSDAITLAADGKCAVTGSTVTADTGKFTNLSNRNLIINGAMQVAQRSTATVQEEGYKTVDRFQMGHSGEDEDAIQSQHALTSSDTGPWEKGFKNSYHIQNGNQTASDAGDGFYVTTAIEAQDIANSGWDYTSASSYVTLSFWVKSSVARAYYIRLYVEDGTAKNYAMQTPSLSANTWTKVTKTIPGNSNIQIDNNNGLGMSIQWSLYRGTDHTDSGVSLNTWANHAGGSKTPDDTDTFWRADNATFEITGVQLEVGDVATEFEHRSYGDELARCQRYYWQETGITFFLYQYNSSHKQIRIQHPVPMRATPTETLTGSGITADSETNQCYSAYAASAYDGSNFFYSAVKFSAEL